MSRKTEQMQIIDKYVGAQIKVQRVGAGLSQQELAERLGISYQQLHKYESGANSVSASRIAEIAKALSVMPAIFFDGIDAEEEAALPDQDKQLQLQFIRHYSNISNKRHRDALQLLIRVLGEETSTL